MDWFRDQFGDEPLRRAVVLPTDDYFPGTYTGTRKEVRAVLRRICPYLGVDPERVQLDFDDDGTDEHNALLRRVGGAWSYHNVAGHYRTRDGQAVIGIDMEQAKRPMALVATIAHELAHHRLLGENRIPADREDGEPLTDLLTVYMGLGIFAANAAYDFSRWANDDMTGWSSRHLGYLTEPMFGYGLARFAWLRGEHRPDWESYVDTNPREALKQGLRYLWRAD